MRHLYFITREKEKAACSVIDGTDERILIASCARAARPVQNPHEAKLALFERLQDCGAATGYEEREEGGGSVFYFSLTDEVKKKYFAQKYKNAERALKEMGIEGFSTSTLYVDDFLQNIESTKEGDYVTNSFAVYSFDTFMRRASTGVRYYIGAVDVLLTVSYAESIR